MTIEQTIEHRRVFGSKGSLGVDVSDLTRRLDIASQSL